MGEVTATVCRLGKEGKAVTTVEVSQASEYCENDCRMVRIGAVREETRKYTGEKWNVCFEKVIWRSLERVV